MCDDKHTQKTAIERVDRAQEQLGEQGMWLRNKERRRKAGPEPDPLDNNNHFSRGTRRVDTLPPADDTQASQPRLPARPTRHQLHLHDGTETPACYKVMERLSTLNINPDLSSLIQKSHEYDFLLSLSLRKRTWVRRLSIMRPHPVTMSYHGTCGLKCKKKSRCISVNKKLNR